MPLSSKEILFLATQAALDKKAQEIVALKLIGLTDFTDYFVICSGSSNVQIQAIADAIIEILKKERVEIDHYEGYQQALWVLLDFGQIIVHIFNEDTRNFYQLEHLWGNAKRIDLE